MSQSDSVTALVWETLTGARDWVFSLQFKYEHFFRPDLAKEQVHRNWLCGQVRDTADTSHILRTVQVGFSLSFYKVSKPSLVQIFLENP